jgi:DNA ligase (NAD+)
MAKLIFGLGIRHVGKKTAQIICEHFTTIDDLANATVEELIAIEDVGDVCCCFDCWLIWKSEQ